VDASDVLRRDATGVCDIRRSRCGVISAALLVAVELEWLAGAVPIDSRSMAPTERSKRWQGRPFVCGVNEVVLMPSVVASLPRALDRGAAIPAASAIAVSDLPCWRRGRDLIGNIYPKSRLPLGSRSFQEASDRHVVLHYARWQNKLCYPATSQLTLAARLWLISCWGLLIVMTEATLRPSLLPPCTLEDD